MSEEERVATVVKIYNKIYAGVDLGRGGSNFPAEAVTAAILTLAVMVNWNSGEKK